MNKDRKNEEIIKQIVDIYHQNKGRYNYRRTQLELANCEYSVDHIKIKRIMNLFSIHRTSPRGKINPIKGINMERVKVCYFKKLWIKQTIRLFFERNFITTTCNQKWTKDVSEFHIVAGKLYLSLILDMHTREIVSYNLSNNPSYYQTRDMLRKALDKYYNLEGLILYSDQGRQYQMYHYHKELESRGVQQSMFRKGNCPKIRLWITSLLS